MTIDSRAGELLALIEAHRAARCGAILDEARQRASHARAEAAAEARARMRQAFTEERRHAAERIAAAQARLATRRRVVEQHRAQALLVAAWQRLPLVLAQRWDDPAPRSAWIDRAIAHARELLEARAWRVAHPPTWTASERATLARTLADSGIDVEWIADPGIRAGLRIGAGANVIDCTQDGLLADRTDIGARLLYALESPP